MDTTIINLSSDTETSQSLILKLSSSIVADESIEISTDNILETITVPDSDDDGDNDNRGRQANQRNSSPRNNGFFSSQQLSNNKASISSFDVSEIFTEDETRNVLSLNKANEAKTDNSSFRERAISYGSENSSSSNSIYSLDSGHGRSEDLKRPQINSRNNSNLGNKNIEVGRDNGIKADTRYRKLVPLKPVVNTPPLTKKEAQKILTTLKSQRLVHDSPGKWARSKVKLDFNESSSSSSDGEHNPALINAGSTFTRPPVVTHPACISETDSGSDDHEVDKPPERPSSKSETYGVKLTLGRMESPLEFENHHVLQWLASNSFTARSSTNSSHVPLSERGSISRNNSLEEFEKDHETPNNRDRFRYNLGRNEKENWNGSETPKNQERFQKNLSKNEKDNWNGLETPKNQERFRNNLGKNERENWNGSETPKNQERFRKNLGKNKKDNWNGSETPKNQERFRNNLGKNERENWNGSETPKNQDRFQKNLGKNERENWNGSESPKNQDRFRKNLGKNEKVNCNGLETTPATGKAEITSKKDRPQGVKGGNQLLRLKTSPAIFSPVLDKVPSTKVDDCVNILNKIYGDKWMMSDNVSKESPLVGGKVVGSNDQGSKRIAKPGKLGTHDQGSKRDAKPGKSRSNDEDPKRDAKTDTRIRKIEEQKNKSDDLPSRGLSTLNKVDKNSKDLLRHLGSVIKNDDKIGLKHLGSLDIRNVDKVRKDGQHHRVGSAIRNDDFEDRISDVSSDDEPTFVTASATPVPRSHQLLRKNQTPSGLTKKILDLCDSETSVSDDDEVDPRQINKHLVNCRESSLTNCTSEYDPDDIIPPKILPTKLGPKAHPTRHKNSFLKSLSASVALGEAHPDAIKYRKNYKNTRDELCKHLFNYYNKEVFGGELPDDMLIEWNNRMRGTAGFCYNKLKKKVLGGIERASRIQLATKVVDTPDRLRDTLIHEMCHAATWIINHETGGHGVHWRAWASKAIKRFPELPPIKRCHDYQIATKYTYRCVGCGYSIGRHSKSLDTEKKRCGHCYGKFELLINKTTKSGDQRQVSADKPLTGFALFVKENYRVVQSEQRHINHKDVMKILGQKFSELKVSKQNK